MPDYIVYKKSGIDKIRITAGYRAVKLEEKALKGGNRRLLIECIKAREREKGCCRYKGSLRVFTPVLRSPNGQLPWILGCGFRKKV